MNTNITAFILAGGESRRFGENKALFQYKKKPLIAHVIDKISGSFKNLVIIGKNDAIYRKFGYTVIEDLLPYQNPLVGIYTGLMYSNTDWNFFIACDMPFFNAGSVLKLVKAIPEPSDGLEIVVSRTTQGIEPMAALYHKLLTNAIQENMSEFVSLKAFIHSRNRLIIDFGSSEPFRNINYKDQLRGFGM